jgi:cellulose biosynthesis protein BcsQ
MKNRKRWPLMPGLMSLLFLFLATVLLSQAPAPTAPAEPTQGSQSHGFFDWLTGTWPRWAIFVFTTVGLVCGSALKFLGKGFGDGFFFKIWDRMTPQSKKGMSDRLKESSKILRALLPKLMRAAPPNYDDVNDILKKRLAAYHNEYGLPPDRAADEHQRRIIALVSGKGGVGKSSIALGLLEFFAAQEGPTLLIDFDMPNRGLTSLLGERVAEIEREKKTSVLAQLDWFMKELRRKRPAAREEASTKEPQASEKSGVQRPTRRAPLGRHSLPLIKLSKNAAAVEVTNKVDGKVSTLRDDKAYFLPSIEPPDKFLSSEVFHATEVEVAEFLHNLDHRLPVGVKWVIVDCHGAHDLFMVGAIQAATDLVVTMTPEAGSFDGTYDLVSYALSIGDERRTISTTLLVNNVSEKQQLAAEALEKFYTGTKVETVPVNDRINPGHVEAIASTEAVRDFMNGYQLGDVSKTTLWTTICNVGTYIIGAGTQGQTQNGSIQSQASPVASEE